MFRSMMGGGGAASGGDSRQQRTMVNDSGDEKAQVIKYYASFKAQSEDRNLNPTFF